MTHERVLERKVKRREGLRIVFNNKIKSAEDYLSGDNVEEAKLKAFKSIINKSVEQLSDVNDEIEALLEPDQVPNDIVESLEIQERATFVESEIDVRLSQIVKANDLTASLALSTPSVSSISNVSRLPKIELPVFNGDPLKWQGFWDQFQTSIHNNERITDIDRFNFLKRYLGGEALDSVEGLSLNSENYKEAIELLTDRYGNEQVLISAHMQSLLKIQKVRSKDNVKGLRSLYNHVESCVRNLKALKLEVRGYGSLLIPLLKEKLPDDLIIVISRRFGSSVWELDLLLKHLNEELRAQENCSTSVGGRAERSERDNLFSASNLFSQSKPLSACVFCHDDRHNSSRCRKVTNVHSRKDILVKERRCFICLESGHRANSCRAKYICKKCNGRHNIAICENSDKKNYSDKPTNTSSNQVSTTEISNSRQCSCERSTKREELSSNCAQTSGSILLQTATSEINSLDGGKGVNTRLLFDTGSQRSYITCEMKERLGLRVIRKDNVIIKTFGDIETSQVKRLDVVQFKVRHKKSKRFIFIEALCVPEICSPIANQRLAKAQKIKEFVGLEFADFCNEYSLSIGILIGLDFYFDFFTGNRIESKERVVACESALGWILCGTFGSRGMNESFYSHQMKIEIQNVDSDLISSLNKFWQIEKDGTDNDTDDTDGVISQFSRDIHHDGKRYVTKLPFRPDHEAIPDNFSTCLKRLNSLEKRLERQQIGDAYNEIFVDYERNGIVEKVPEAEVAKEKGTVHYLPHRPVIREDKSTTKIRAVFDASCSVNGVSLNDCLYPGPNLLTKIFDILLRFRLNKIAITADIKQAFLNIGIHPEHRDFVRFIWRNHTNPDGKIDIYRFNRVVFGLTSSPFLLNATIRKHWEQYLHEDSAFVKKFLKDLYVDDTTSGVNSVDEGKYFHSTSNRIMSEAGLLLRKWTSNNPELQSYFDSEEQSVKSSVEDDTSFAQSQFLKSEESCRRVLGIEWDLKSDKFVFRFNDFLKKGREMKLTKRSILSLSASLYDPLGFVSPITARVKTVFQLICKEKSSWDDKVSLDISKVWFEFLDALENLKVLEVDRFCFVPNTSEVKSVELHGFSDSSKVVYCAVVYLRVVFENCIRVFFLCSKNKVAPLKKITIPRLELVGCLLLTNLIGSVRRAISSRIKIDSTHCWTDSEVALCWIKGNRKLWKPWVESRVVDIRKVVEKGLWHHIPGETNPADIPTRMVSDFKEILVKNWFNGPEMLFDPNLSFPCSESFVFPTDEVVVSSVLTEVRSRYVKDESFLRSFSLSCDDDSNTLTETDCLITNIDSNESLVDIIDIKRYSSLTRLITVTAYVLRFINNIKWRIKKRRVRVTNNATEEDTNEKEIVITAEEREAALMKWIFEEQSILANNKYFSKQSSSLRLYPDNGILRLRGRFDNSVMTEDQKHPIILRDITSDFTKLIILHSHVNTIHQGVEATLANIRRRFWIVKGRKAVKTVLKKCVICKRYQGRTMKLPASPDLPDFRLDFEARAFSSVGIDFAGPIFYRNFSNCKTCDKQTFKSYILLLTCATTRAIHLELVPDLSVESFIRAFKRFAARRGTPSLIISDNAKTFRSRKVKSFMSAANITQKFILPASPWWGGFYERLVRSVKSSLRKILGLSYLTYEEIETILIEVESTINSRPLTYINEDDLNNIITPNHLIFGTDIHNNNNNNNNNNTSKIVFVPIKRLKNIQRILIHFRKRFASTYMNELRQSHIYRRKQYGDKRQLVIGDLVLIKDDMHLPRSLWKTGRIVKLITGRDNNIRGAQLDTITKTGRRGIVHRPLTKLIPFEIVEPGPESNVHPAESSKSCKEKIAHTTRSSTRKAAIEGQNLRRLRDIVYK